MANWPIWQKSILNILLGLLIGGIVYLIASQPRGQPIELDPVSTPAPITVHVTGNVIHPGVYKLPAGSRVENAIQAAGGFVSPKNGGSLNQAGLLRDGQQVFVGEASPISSTLDPMDRMGIVNLNSADKETLMTLPGIGEIRAQDILSYREQKGGFTNVEDLLEVTGIGQATFEKLKPFITIGK